MLPSSDYDDPAALERTMDDIAMDLATQQQDFEDRPPPTFDQAAAEEEDEEVETPRAANIIVNSVELTGGCEDESASDEYEETEKNDDNRSNWASNLKRFGGFEALNRLESDHSPSISEQRDEEDDGGGNHEQSFFDRTLDQTLDEVEVDLEKIDNSFGFSIQVDAININKYSIEYNTQLAQF